MKMDMKFTAHINQKRPEAVLAAMMKGIDYGAIVIKKRARELCPVKTGKLKKSIEIKPIAGGKSIGPDTNYDAYVEFGTMPHVIEPKNPGGVLHWVDESGKDCFAKRVMHPGTAAQPYMRPALQENRKPISDRTSKLIREALK